MFFRYSASFRVGGIVILALLATTFGALSASVCAEPDQFGAERRNLLFDFSAGIEPWRAIAGGPAGVTASALDLSRASLVARFKLAASNTAGGILVSDDTEVTLSGCLLEGGATGFVARGSSVVLAVDATIRGAEGIGADVQGAASVTLRRLAVDGSGGHGVRLCHRPDVSRHAAEPRKRHIFDRHARTGLTTTARMGTARNRPSFRPGISFGYTQFNTLKLLYNFCLACFLTQWSRVGVNFRQTSSAPRAAGP